MLENPYTSASLCPETAGRAGNIQWIIESKHGRVVDGLSNVPSEHEVLFDRFTRFEVFPRSPTTRARPSGPSRCTSSSRCGCSARKPDTLSLTMKRVEGYRDDDSAVIAEARDLLGEGADHGHLVCPVSLRPEPRSGASGEVSRHRR